MHIEYFEYFNKVAKAKSISKVAKNIHISQSALSQQIQKLEDSLGYKLLERSNKGVKLTEMGEIVLKYSENIINVFDKMLEELNKGKNRSNTIKIGACPSISHYALPCSLYKIKEEFPYHKYELFTNTSPIIKESVINDLYEVGFVYKDTNEKDLNYYRVGTNKFILVASTYYDIEKTIKLEELIEYPMITLAGKDELMEKVDQGLKKKGQSIENLNIVFQLDSIEGVKSSVNRKHGLAFLPYISIKEELYKKQYKVINIEDNKFDLDVYMINKRRESINKSVKDFIEHFKLIGEKSFC